MRQDRQRRLERQEEQRKHLSEPDGLIIYDAETGELLAYDSRAWEDEGDGTIILLPHNNRETLEETTLWKKAQIDKSMRLSDGRGVATVQLFPRHSDMER